MYLIALKMLFGDKGKYVSMIVGISFSTLIMTQQPSILVGLLSRTYSFIRDVSAPDIWVMDTGVQFVEENKPLRDTELTRIRSVSGIAWAVPLYKGLQRAKLPDGSTKTLDVTGIDDATLIGAPAKIIHGSLTNLKRPDAIFVDQEAANTRLRVKVSETETRPLALGDMIEINDKRAHIVGIIKATRNFVLQPQIYTTYNRALSFAGTAKRSLTYVLVKVKTGEDPKQICTQITQRTGLRAQTADEFSDANLNYWMKSTGIPINFGISVLLGFIVGTAVVGQTFFNFVQENIKHYAVLKAMGLRNTTLSKMVILQACVVGIIGYGIGVGLASLFALKFHDSVLAVRMPPILLFFSGMGVLLIILTAAIISVKRVIRVDPAVVFRG